MPSSGLRRVEEEEEASKQLAERIGKQQGPAELIAIDDISLWLRDRGGKDSRICHTECHQSPSLLHTIQAAAHR